MTRVLAGSPELRDEDRPTVLKAEVGASGRLRRIAAPLFGALVMLSLGGCAYQPVNQTPLETVLQATDQVDAKGYLVAVGDVLTVKFYFNPELDFDVPVRQDGQISLSLIGNVQAAGHTPEDLSATVTNAYKAFLKQSAATVIVKTPAGHRVFVSGEVFLPGTYTLQGNETALSALSTAGGISTTGSYDQVVLVRRLPDHHDPMVAVLDLTKALTGADTRQDVTIRAGDVLYIPRTGNAEANVRLKNVIWGKAPISGSASATLDSAR